MRVLVFMFVRTLKIAASSQLSLRLMCGEKNGGEIMLLPGSGNCLVRPWVASVTPCSYPASAPMFRRQLTFWVVDKGRVLLPAVYLHRYQQKLED